MKQWHYHKILVEMKKQNWELDIISAQFNSKLFDFLSTILVHEKVVFNSEKKLN